MLDKVNQVFGKAQSWVVDPASSIQYLEIAIWNRRRHDTYWLLWAHRWFPQPAWMVRSCPRVPWTPETAT